MLLRAAVAAWRQVLSRPLRAILWRSLALTVLLLAIVWFGLTRLFSHYLAGHPLSASYPILDGFAFFLAGAGLFVALAYILPSISAVVAGFFLDDAAEIVERTDFPADPPGRALPLGKALLYGLRFAGLSLLVNLIALLLFFVPVVNLVAFFGANAYLLGREYFELAALRFHPPGEASRLRTENRPTVLLAGAMMAGLLLVPVLNLLTPLFGVALMVHVHKALSARALAGPRWAGSLPRVEPGAGPR
jgi:CysZ protein